jgi:pimeloyl-[acyl-carrier protein] methyl ester esterase
MTPLGVTRVGDGPALALVPGWGFAAPALRGLAEALAVRHTVELVDLPGHGASRGIAMPPDLPGLGALLDATLPETRDWIGWSLGGLACLQFALARPQRVRRLALLAASPRFTAHAGWTGGMPREALEGFASALESDPAATLERFAGLVAHGDTEARGVLRRLRAVLDASPRPDPEALAAGLTLLAEGNLTTALGGAAAPPTLWLLGACDALVPADLATTLADRPGAEVILVEDAGHAPFLSRTAACTAHLERFFDD